MRKGTKFTPINILQIKSICKDAGLIENKCEFEKGIIGNTDSAINASIGFGLDKDCAAISPVVIIYEDGSFELNQNPKLVKDTYKDGTCAVCYECGWQINYIGSMERFKNFFDIALEKHKNVYNEYLKRK